MKGERTLLLAAVMAALLLLGAVGWVLLAGPHAGDSGAPAADSSPEAHASPSRDDARRASVESPSRHEVPDLPDPPKRKRHGPEYLQGSEWVEGVVRDLATAKPVPQFDITALLVERGPRRRKVLFHKSQRFQSPDGRFLLEGLPAGTLQITASANGYVDDTRTDVPIGLGGPRPVVEFALKSPWVLRGTVRNSYGGPLAGLQVFLLGEAPEEPRQVNRPHRQRDARRTIGQAQTAANGTFRLSSTAEGTFTLLVGPRKAPLVSLEPIAFRIGNRYVQDVTVPDQAEIELDVQGANYRPLPGARVTLWSQGLGNPVNGSTDAQGRFRQDRIVPGVYRLLVSKSNHKRFSDRVELHSGEILRRTIVLEPFENPFHER